MAAPFCRTSSSGSLMSICRYCLQHAHPILGIASVRLGSNRTSIAKTNRQKYTRFYPTIVVNQDGSTYWIKYPEPRYILKRPVDVNSLSAEERKLRLKRYVPKKKEVVIEDDDLGDDDFDSNKYKHLWKRK